MTTFLADMVAVVTSFISDVGAQILAFLPTILILAGGLLLFYWGFRKVRGAIR